MITKRVGMKARPVFDPMMDGDEHQFKFFTLEGSCKKCYSSDHSLVYFEFIENKKNKGQSIFRTMCMVCGDRNMNYSKDITVITGDLPPEPEGYPKLPQT